MSKHTPGPWGWEGNTLSSVNKNYKNSAVYSILDAEGGYGFVGSDLEDTLSELEADRTLIAASPDLLTALQVMLRDYTAVHDIGDVEMQPAIYQASAAIAKATGGQA